MSSESNQLVAVIGPFGSEARRTELCKNLSTEVPSTIIDYTALLSNPEMVLATGQLLGECRQTVVLNGFPHTTVQAEQLVQLRPDVLFVVVEPSIQDVQKQLGHWIAEHCMPTEINRARSELEIARRLLRWRRISRRQTETFNKVMKTLWHGGYSGLILHAALSMEVSLKQTLLLLNPWWSDASGTWPSDNGEVPNLAS